jgi:drug/metabolite transporter (DMT)-like permease
MQSSALALIIAFLGYSLHNIAQAGQKIGLARYRRQRGPGAAIWAISTAGTSVSFFLVLAAISIGSISLVGAMAGTGLVSLAIFSHFVMRERVDKREVSALTVIIAGAGLAGAVAGAAEGPSDGTVRTGLLWALLAGGSVLYSIVWIATRKTRHTGAVVGGFSGFLGAYSQLFQEHGTSAVSAADGFVPFAASLITNPVTLVWVGLSVVSMIVLQFSYRHGRAIEIIPSFVGNFIVVPVLGGVIIFGQNLAVVQWIGVAMITAGSVVLGRGQVEVAAVAQSVAERRAQSGR